MKAASECGLGPVGSAGQVKACTAALISERQALENNLLHKGGEETDIHGQVSGDISAMIHAWTTSK
jgi:hypothetical protein